jgi:hypothetical protein
MRGACAPLRELPNAEVTQEAQKSQKNQMVVERFVEELPLENASVASVFLL